MPNVNEFYSTVYILMAQFSSITNTDFLIFSSVSLKLSTGNLAVQMYEVLKTISSHSHPVCQRIKIDEPKISMSTYTEDKD